MNEEKEQSVSTTKEPLESQTVGKKDGRPHYLLELHKRWCRWTEIDDPDVLESLDYLSGNLFFEMRKLTSQSCILNEETEKRLIRKISAELGIQNDREKLRAVGTIIFDAMRSEKEALKGLIDKSWRDIVDKQKVGIDKICIVVTKNIFDKVKEKKEIANNTQSNGQESKSETPTRPKQTRKATS